MAWLVMGVCVLLCSTVYGGELPVEPNDGVGFSLWALAGDGVQELRLGYEGFLPDIEVALGLGHVDAPDDGVEEWPIRAYLLAHTLDADMIATALGQNWTLPDGNLYGGLLAEYTYDRPKEWSGGYVVGGLVDWPRGWQTVAEYEGKVWNNDDREWSFVLGVRKSF